jgi:hypothetical protein
MISTRRTTRRKIAALVMLYLLVIDRLKRVFSNPRDAELVNWHSEKCRKNFDLQYKPFGLESRNIRFTLSIDGINPFGENRTMHNTWPVILVMYNLPI